MVTNKACRRKDAPLCVCMCLCVSVCPCVARLEPHASQATRKSTAGRSSPSTDMPLMIHWSWPTFRSPSLDCISPSAQRKPRSSTWNTREFLARAGDGMFSAHVSDMENKLKSGVNFTKSRESSAVLERDSTQGPRGSTLTCLNNVQQCAHELDM